MFSVSTVMNLTLRNQNQNHADDELMMVDRVCALYIGWGMGSWLVRTLSLFALNSRLHTLDQAYTTDSCLNIMIYLFLISFQFLQIPLDVQYSPFLCLTQCSLAEIELQT